jgi:rod shape-determining protein MreD
VKPAVALLLISAFAVMVQGAAAGWIEQLAVPDLGLLIVVALGTRWRSLASGIALAALIGYVADLLSGSLLGQHALLRMLAFAAARVGSRSLNLRGALPQAVFVGILTLVNALGVAVLTAFFVPDAGFGLASAGALLTHAGINAVFAPLVALGTDRILGLVSDGDAGRRLLRIEPRRAS